MVHHVAVVKRTQLVVKSDRKIIKINDAHNGPNEGKTLS